jgi:hypothetical protein
MAAKISRQVLESYFACKIQDASEVVGRAGRSLRVVGRKNLQAIVFS